MVRAVKSLAGKAAEWRRSRGERVSKPSVPRQPVAEKSPILRALKGLRKDGKSGGTEAPVEAEKTKRTKKTKKAGSSPTFAALLAKARSKTSVRSRARRRGVSSRLAEKLPNPPPFVKDLYLDLRDRRLLPVVGLMVVALIAVPMLLSSSPKAEEAGGAGLDASSAQLASELALETQPVVLADGGGIRDYRKRLRDFRRKNPFKQQMTTPDLDKAGVERVLDDVEKALSEVDPGGGGTGTSAPSITSPTGSAPSTGSPGGTSEPKKPSPRFYSYAIDVRFGEVGETHLRRKVKRMTLLPSKTVPLLAFLGVSTNEKEAIFLVSKEIGSQGEGICAPSEESCQFLNLRRGQTQFLDVGAGTDDHVTYELKLERIRRISTKASSSVKTESGGGDSAAATEPETTKDPEASEGSEGAKVGGSSKRRSSREAPDALAGWLKLAF